MIRFLATVGIGLAGTTSAVAQTADCPGGPPGWIAAQGSGCRVWNLCPQRDESVTWSGACPTGFASGRGVTQWFRSGQPGARFEGTLRDGKRQGRGVYIFFNGNRYEGEFVDDKRQGRGVFTWTNGSRYDGEWRNGERHGRGVFTEADGSRYDGEWRDGVRQGRGILTWANGDRYEGEFRDDNINGRGSFVGSGGRYEGEWRNGKPNGQGIARSGNDIYSGTWTNGCFRQGDRLAMWGATKAECGFR